MWRGFASELFFVLVIWRAGCIDKKNNMSKRKNYKETDYGEFQFVARKISPISLVEKAHKTPCSKREAINILKWLSMRHFKDKDFLIIRWINKGKFNYGGTEFIKGKKMPYIELHPDKKSIKKKIYGLRVGIVLHEFAHALANYNSNKNRGEGHGKIFIQTFQKVLRLWDVCMKL